jgi:hypothetical protein
VVARSWDLAGNARGSSELLKLMRRAVRDVGVVRSRGRARPAVWRVGRALAEGRGPLREGRVALAGGVRLAPGRCGLVGRRPTDAS